MNQSSGWLVFFQFEGDIIKKRGAVGEMPDGKSPRAFASLPPVSASSPPNLEPARSRTDEGRLLHRNRSEFKEEFWK
jgi:hypothetical protein